MKPLSLGIVAVRSWSIVLPAVREPASSGILAEITPNSSEMIVISPDSLGMTADMAAFFPVNPSICPDIEGMYPVIEAEKAAFFMEISPENLGKLARKSAKYADESASMPPCNLGNEA